MKTCTAAVHPIEEKSTKHTAAVVGSASVMQHASRRAYLLFMILDGLSAIIVPMFAKFCVTAGRCKAKIMRKFSPKLGAVVRGRQGQKTKPYEYKIIWAWLV